ncbi:MAG TPA: biopolymer transporter ExbD [Verrucomicrobiae bacterium]|jgi:biopolymer transport protein ExbD
MQFTNRKRRGPPSVIIVSLIDVLIVVLIFLMVTTTFKQTAALKVVLPKSNQPKSGATTETREVIVTIPKSGPLYFAGVPVTFEKLEQRLRENAAATNNLTLAIRADTDAPWGEVVKVRDAASAANIKVVSASVDSAAAK